MNETQIKASACGIVDMILCELQTRNGFSERWWDQVPAGVKVELVERLESATAVVISHCLKNATNPQ